MVDNVCLSGESALELATESEEGLARLLCLNVSLRYR